MARNRETAVAIVDALRDLIREEISLADGRLRDPEWVNPQAAQDAADTLEDLITANLAMRS
jgi:hypothetical protein